MDCYNNNNNKLITFLGCQRTNVKNVCKAEREIKKLGQHTRQRGAGIAQQVQGLSFGLDHPRFILGKEKSFSLLEDIQPGSGDDPVSYSVGTGGGGISGSE